MSYAGDDIDNAPVDDLAFDFDTTGFKSEDQIAASNNVPDGRYCVTVEDVARDHNSAKPCVKFTFVVKDGTVPGHKNRKIFERLFLTEENKQRALLFANRLGVIKAADLDNPHVRKNWGDAKNQLCVVEVKTKEVTKADGSKAKYTNLSFGGIWKMTDPEVKDVPKGDGKPAAPATAGAAAASSGDFNDL